MGSAERPLWEHCEMATTTTTVSMWTTRRKRESQSIAVPHSLALWGADEAAGSESTLGLHQMRGYEDLQRLEQAPVQWADDEDRGGAKAREPISTIAFPLSSDADEPRISRRLHPPGKSSERQTDHMRHHSLPLHQPPSAVQRGEQRLPRHSTAAAHFSRRNNMSSRAGAPADSSGSSSPEGKVMSLDQMSLRQRSMRSLQGIASAWVPAAVRSPYESDSESTTPGRSQKRADRRPVRLDQRRLDKAINLAVEAAQASKQDERVWKERKKRLARRQSYLECEQEERKRADISSSRFASLPWRRPRSRRMLPQEHNAVVPFAKPQTSESDSDDGGDSSDNVRKAPGLQPDDESDDSEADEAVEGADGADGFSIDLYVSSLGYLLEALSPGDAENVGEKHREDIKRKLEEALRHLDGCQGGGLNAIDREEVIQLRVEKEVALLEQAYHTASSQSQPTRTRQAAQVSSDRRIRKQSIAGYLTSSALDLGLSVGACALAAASRGFANLLPILTPEGNNSPPNGEGSSPEAIVVSCKSPEAKSIEVSDAGPLLTRSQWELTQTLAHSVAATMYNNLAAVAEQRRQPASQERQPGSNREVALYGVGSKPEDASDQLLVMAATLARSVKRSPLPSQVRALTSQVLSLAVALDQRYSFRKRSADVALRKTGQALYYVRKNELHVKALRIVWAVFEASVAAVEAYRDEEEWEGSEAARIEAGPRAASVHVPVQ